MKANMIAEGESAFAFMVEGMRREFAMKQTETEFTADVRGGAVSLAFSPNHHRRVSMPVARSLADSLRDTLDGHEFSKTDLGRLFRSVETVLTAALD